MHGLLLWSCIASSACTLAVSRHTYLQCSDQHPRTDGVLVCSYGWMSCYFEVTVPSVLAHRLCPHTHVQCSDAVISLCRVTGGLVCRYAWAAISEWQCQQGVTQQGMLGSEVVLSGPTALRRSHSMSCMTQLQAKHAGTPFDQSEAASRWVSYTVTHFTSLSLYGTNFQYRNRPLQP